MKTSSILPTKEVDRHVKPTNRQVLWLFQKFCRCQEVPVNLGEDRKVKDKGAVPKKRQCQPFLNRMMVIADIYVGLRLQTVLESLLGVA